MEKQLGEVISKNEKSVVALGLYRETAGTIDFPRRGIDTDRPRLDDVPEEFATGVIIDRSGLVLTNYHAVKPDLKGTWHMVAPGRKFFYKMRIKAADPRSDLAVLEIVEPRGTDAFTPIKFGKTDKLKKGNIVIALGNPYAIARDGEASASWGIISNLNRKAAPNTAEPLRVKQKTTLHHYGTLIQTDAKLNLGTSGGALLNLQGEMIGLTTSLAALANYEKSAGFAIAVDATFRRVVDRLKEGREVEYGLLGVGPGDLSAERRVGGERGAVIENVVSGSPADEARIHRSDLVTHVEGQPLDDAESLMLEVGKFPPGHRVRLTVKREEREYHPQVVLTKYRVRGEKVVTTKEPAWRGLRVDYPTGMLDIGRGALPGFGRAVVISEVEDNSPASQADLHPGHLVGQVDGIPVTTPKEFHAAVAKAQGEVRLTLVYPHDDNPDRIVGEAAATP